MTCDGFMDVPGSVHFIAGFISVPGSVHFMAGFMGVPGSVHFVAGFMGLPGPVHFIAGFILATIFQTAHVMPDCDFPKVNESGTIENNWAIHQLQTTSNYAPKSRLFSWFVGGLNYQIEHHLFPNICHVHYKSISKIVKEKTQKYNLPYYCRKSYLSAVIDHGTMLKNLGR